MVVTLGVNTIVDGSVFNFDSAMSGQPTVVVMDTIYVQRIVSMGRTILDFLFRMCYQCVAVKKLE